jgi:hypothetical protein
MRSRVVKVTGFHPEDCFYGITDYLGKVGVFTPHYFQPEKGFCNGRFRYIDNRNNIRFLYFYAADLEDVNICK